MSKGGEGYPIKIALVRHGHVEHGDEDRQPGGPSLTETGIYQATLVGVMMARRCRPELVLTSGTKRTNETASLIVAQLPNGSEIPVEHDSRFEERTILQEGQSIVDYGRVFNLTTLSPLDFIPPYGAPTSREVGERVRNAIIEGVERGAVTRLLLVSLHKGSIIDLLRVLGLISDEYIAMASKDGTVHVPEGSVTYLGYNPSDRSFRLDQNEFAKVGHLVVAGATRRSQIPPESA